jgi:hypothetical protein
MHQTKIEFRVQHDATIHTPLGFDLPKYYFISKNSHSFTKRKRKGKMERGEER